MRLQTTIGLAALLALAGLGGCRGEKATADYQIKKMFGGDGHSPTEQAKMAFDEKDPDMRRLAIEELSHRSWALRDPYLKRFAMLTRREVEQDPSVRAVAVRALGKAGDRKYQPEILAALSDPAPMVRWDAAVVMDRMPDEKGVATLQRMAIQDDSVDVRASAALALQHYKTDSVFRTLLRCLDDPDFTVRAHAHKALVQQTGVDHGYDPLRWAGDPSQVGQETIPEPVVVYKKRPWWDWMKMTSETESLSPDAEQQDDHPWWDWMHTTDRAPEPTEGDLAEPSRDMDAGAAGPLD